MDSVFQLGEGTCRNTRKRNDRLAKKAAMDDTGEIVYDKISRENNYRRGERNNKIVAVDKLYKRKSK
jgi:hypothetical protein